MKYALSILFLLIAFGVFFIYTKPAYDSVQQSQEKLSTYVAALQKIGQLDQKRDDLISQNNSFDQTALDRLQKMLPDHVDNIGLILDLDGVASKYGIGLQNINIGSVAGSSTTPAAAIQAGNSSYQPFDIGFTVQGTYDTLMSFLGSLQSSLRLVDISTLNLAPGTVNDPSGQRTYTMQLTLRTYWMK